MVVNCAPALLFRLRSCLLLPAIPEQQAQSGCRRAGREQRLQHVVPGGDNLHPPPQGSSLALFAPQAIFGG